MNMFYKGVLALMCALLPTVGFLTFARYPNQRSTTNTSRTCDHETINRSYA